MNLPKRGLGRGLGEILGGGKNPAAPGTVREVALDELTRGPWQPRSGTNQETLAELAQTVAARGILQPILVRRAGDKLEIVAGERRWRAARLAGLRTVPVLVREMSVRDAQITALVENIQREDLHPLDQAAAARKILEEFGTPLAKVAETLGMSRPALSNLLRLLSLAPKAKQLLKRNTISAGHARAIAPLPAHLQTRAAEKIIAEDLNVRQAEKLAGRLKAGRTPAKAGRSAVPQGADPDTRMLCEELSALLGVKVSVRQGRGGKGRVELSYRSLDSLDSLLAVLRRAGTGGR